MKTKLAIMQEEILRNKQLMKYNIALPINEQTLEELIQAEKACDNPGNNAGDIQKFLGMKPDWDFGDDTAKAVAEYLGYKNISTETELWKHMVKDWPTEFKGGIAGKAQTVIGRLLSERCKQLKKEQEEVEKEEFRYTLHEYMVDDFEEFLEEKPERLEKLKEMINKKIKTQEMYPFPIEVLNERMGDLWTDNCGKHWVPFNYEAQICNQIKNYQLIVYIKELTITDFDGDSIEFEFEGSAYLGGNKLWIDGDGELSFSITANYLYIECDDININSERAELTGALFGNHVAYVSLDDNQLKIDPFGKNYGGDTSGIGPWWKNTPIEKETKKAIDEYGAGINIKDYIAKIWEGEWDELQLK